MHLPAGPRRSRRCRPSSNRVQPAATESSASAGFRLPFFYGWLIAGMVGLSSFLGAGLNNVSLGVLLRPLSEDLGWSRSLTAGAIGAGTVAAGLLAPVAGQLADRYGPRVLLPLGAALSGVLVFAISRVNEPWQFYASYVPARALAEPLLVSVVPMTAVANWFVRRRPRVMGLTAMAVPLGSAVLVLGYQFLIAHAGWRWTLASLAVLYWSCLVVPGLLVLRRRPEDLGLLPDGAPAPMASRPALPRDIQSSTPVAPTVGARDPGSAPADALTLETRSWTVRDAVRTPTFWLLAGSNGLASLATGGTAFNLAAAFTDAHLDPAVAAGALSTFALAGAVGSAVWGVLAEHVSPRGLNVGTLAAAAGALLLLPHVQAPALAYSFAALFGLTARGQGVLVQVQLAAYFGRRSYGAISGLANPFLLGGLGLGPVLAALVYDRTGSYAGIFGIFGALFLVAAGSIGFARPPVPPESGADADR